MKPEPINQYHPEYVDWKVFNNIDTIYPLTPINQISFEPVLCFGKFVLFTGHRIDRSTVPEGLWVYDIRHGDEGDWTDPVEILPHVLCNYMGSIVSTERFPIDFKESYVIMDQNGGDWDYIETLEDEDLWDDYDNIPDTLEGYINYTKNETGWDIPMDRLLPREKEEEN